MNRIEAEKMYQAAVRCVGEGGSVHGGPAEILRACNHACWMAGVGSTGTRPSLLS